VLGKIKKTRKGKETDLELLVSVGLVLTVGKVNGVKIKLGIVEKQNRE